MQIATVLSKSTETAVKIPYGKKYTISDWDIFRIKIPYLMDLKPVFLKVKISVKIPYFWHYVLQTMERFNLSKCPITAEPIRARETKPKSPIVMTFTQTKPLQIPLCLEFKVYVCFLKREIHLKGPLLRFLSYIFTSETKRVLI